MPAATWGRGFGRQWSPWGAAPCPWARCHRVPRHQQRRASQGETFPAAWAGGFCLPKCRTHGKRPAWGAQDAHPTLVPFVSRRVQGEERSPRGRRGSWPGAWLGAAGWDVPPALPRPISAVLFLALSPAVSGAPLPAQPCPPLTHGEPPRRGAGRAGCCHVPWASPSHGPLDASQPILILLGTKAGLCHGVLGTRGSLRGSEGCGWGPGGGRCRSRAVRPALCGAVPQPILPSVRHPLPSPSPVGLRASFWGGRNPPSPQGTGHPRAALRPGALCALAQRSQEMGLPFPSSPQLFLPGRESPKASLAHYIAAHLFLPSTNKRTSLVIYFPLFPTPSPPPPPVLSNRRPIRVQTWGAGVGQPLSNFTLAVAGLQPATRRQKGCH